MKVVPLRVSRKLGPLVGIEMLFFLSLVTMNMLSHSDALNSVEL